MAVKGFYLILILFITVSALPAEPVNPILDSLIDIALKNNPELKTMQFRFEAAQFKKSAAGSLPDPMVMVEAMNLPQSSWRLDESAMSGIQLGIAQMIPWPGRLKIQKKMAGLESDIMAEDTEGMKNKIIAEISQMYYEYSFAKISSDIIDSSLQLLENMISSAEVAYANGGMSIQNILEAKISKSGLENQKLKMLQMKKNALFKLNQMLNSPPPNNAEIEAILPENISAMNFIDETVPDLNPRWKMAEISQKMAIYNLSMVKTEYLPDFTLGAAYQFRQVSPMDMTGDDFISFSAQFNLPLWFSRKQSNNTRSALRLVKAAESQTEAIHDELVQRLETVRSELGTLSESIAAYDKNILPQAESAYQAARTAYEVGQVEFEILTMSQMNLLDIKMERLELIGQFWNKMAELKEISGNKTEVNQ